MTDMTRIAHDVAVESGMAHESLSALTAVIQEGIDRALAAKGVHRMTDPTREKVTAREPFDPVAYVLETLAAWAPAHAVDDCRREIQTLAAASLSAGEPDGMETTASVRADLAGMMTWYVPSASEHQICKAALAEIDRLTEALKCSQIIDSDGRLVDPVNWINKHLAARVAKAREEGFVAGIEAERRDAVNRARSKP